MDIIYSTGQDADDTIGYTYASSVIGFFWSGTDTRVRQEYYFQSASALAMDGSLVAFTATTAISGGGTSTTNQTGVTVTMSI
jgi:hypothetical protein